MANNNNNNNSNNNNHPPPTPPHQKSLLDTVRKLRKRQQTPVYNGVGTTLEDKNSDYLCPICFEMITEAHMTKCGHTFCFGCITKSLEYNNKCPKCNFTIEKKDQIFPNFLLNELIRKQQRKVSELKIDVSKIKGISDLQEIFSQESDHLNLTDVNYMLEVLSQKKLQIEAAPMCMAQSRAVNARHVCKACFEMQARLLKEFLLKVRSHKQEELKQINEEISVVDHDSHAVDEMLKKHALLQNSILERNDASRQRTDASTSKNCNFNHLQDGFNGSKYCKRPQPYSSVILNRRKRMHSHFSDLEQTYFSTRKKNGTFVMSDDAMCRLNEFKESLCKFTRFTSIRSLATLNYANDHYNGSNIVSSIEFDKDNEFFAIAGVTKKIKMFEYGTVICDTVDVHYPINEMLCNSKISCISWSSYHKGMLASSDYEGTVTLWDAFTGHKVKIFQEHEKRCWSVDFNRLDTKLIASGSDDSKVKLWSTAMDHSITCLEAKANVCCVKFNPESRYHLTFGSADHCVHYYDLRNTKQPLEVFKGHKKAVSYVKFLNTDVVVSASTDSQLKLWNVNQPHCLRSFKGHLNEKNFVGLATDGDFIACGSENNSLYVYYKGLSSHVLSFKFETTRNILEREKRDEDANEFVSAVCWRTGTNVVVAANSQGAIKVLELV